MQPSTSSPRRDARDTLAIGDLFDAITRQDTDARSELSRALDAEGLYMLPAATRQSMVNQVLFMSSQSVAGRHYITAELVVPEALKRARPATGTDLDPANDRAWARHLKENPSILKEAVEVASAAYTAKDASLLDMGAGFELNVKPVPNTDLFALTSLGGVELGAASIHDMRVKLEAMSTTTLEKTWMAARVFREDFSPTNMRELLADEMVKARMTFEEELLDQDNDYEGAMEIC